MIFILWYGGWSWVWSIAFTLTARDKQFSLFKTTHAFLVLCRNMLSDTISTFGLNWIEMIFEYSNFWVHINLIGPLSVLVCSYFVRLLRCVLAFDWILYLYSFIPLSPPLNPAWILHIRSWRRRNQRKKNISSDISARWHTHDYKLYK